MRDKKAPRDAIVVAVGHEQRLGALAEGVADLEDDPEMERLRRDADALLGKPPPVEALAAVRTVPAAAGPPSWDDVVATNRAALVSVGIEPEGVRVDDLLDEESLARIEREWAEMVADVEAHLDEQRIAALTYACRRSVIDAIVRPFGLGRLVARFDRVGGAVLTPHNAEAGRAGAVNPGDLTNQTKVAEYIERRDEPYSHKDYERGFPAMRKARFKDDTPLEDAYTGRPLTRDGQTHLDHVIPAKQIHTDTKANFFFDKDGKVAAANANENLAYTSAPLNQSKNDERPGTWMEKEDRGGGTKAVRFGVERERAERLEERAEASLADRIRGPELKYYLLETAKAGTTEAAKMGLQQALGLLLVEVTVGVFDELASLIREGTGREGIVAALKVRAKRVLDRVVNAWRDVVDAFLKGALVGLLSVIVTAVINTLVTTAQRVVRMIREGAFSLCRAVAVLVNPPEGMDLMTAAHEASKLVAGGVVISGGIAMEHAVETAIASVPFLAPVAPALTAVSVGLLTGLTTVLVIAALDRFDFFGAIATGRGEQRRKALAAKLDDMLDAIGAG